MIEGLKRRATGEGVQLCARSQARKDGEGAGGLSQRALLLSESPNSLVKQH